MNRFKRMTLLITWVCISAFFLSPTALSASNDLPPSKNRSFTLLDSGNDHVRIHYHNQNLKKRYRVISSTYVGIPVDATYEISFTSWIYQTLETQDQQSERVSSESMTNDASAAFLRSLTSSTRIHRYAFQEMDILKIEIDSSPNYKDAQQRNVSLADLTFDIHWQEGTAYRPEEKSRTDAGYARLYNNLCINGDRSASLRRKRTLPDEEKTKGFAPAVIGYSEKGDLINPGESSPPPRQDAVRVRVRKTGMVAVRPTDLAKQGVSPDDVQLDQVRAWHLGKEVPLTIFDDDNNHQFTPGDAIVFWGQETDSDYTADTQYYLTWFHQDSPPQRIDEEEVAFVNEGEATFTARKILDEDKILVEEKQKQLYGWYFFEMDQFSKEVALDLPGLAEEGQVVVTLDTYNKSHLTTGFTLQIGDATAHYALSHRVNSATSYIFQVPVSTVRSATSMVITLDQEPEVYVPPKGGGLSEKVGNVPHVFFDRMVFQYPRQANLEEEDLWIDGDLWTQDAAALTIHATGTERNLSAWVMDASGTIKRYHAKSKIPLGHFPISKGDWKRIELSYDDDLPGPYTIDRDYRSTLHRKDQGYDYLIIAPHFMVDTARELANRRAKDGFHTLLIDVQDIYDEFNYGYPHSEAIRRFLRYTQSEWSGLSPEFVVLIGDCSWDHRDRLGYGSPDLLPTYAPENNPMHDASDEWYAYLWGGAGDHFSDVIIGRISVASIKDLKNYLIKIDTYETQSGVGPWRSQNIYVTDDDSGMFERFAVSHSQKNLPACFSPIFIHQGDYPLVTNPYLYHRFQEDTDPRAAEFRNKKYCPECALAIIDRFNKGALILQYIGHGGNQIWSEERIFYGTDRPTSNLLEMKPTSRFPFVVSWSCLTGYLNFHIPPFTVCMSEELIRYPDRGAIAMWGPSGGGYTNKHMTLSTIMHRALALDGLDRLGEAMTFTKVEFLQEDFSPDLTDQYILFGDPAVRLAMPGEQASLSIQPPFYHYNRRQDFTIESTLKTLEKGKAVVSMTIEGENVYNSPPIAFSNHTLRHRFPLAINTIEGASASVRFYAWNEEEKRDAWGGLQIPLKRSNLELKEGTVSDNGPQKQIQFYVVNPSPFVLENVQCVLRLGDKEQPLLVHSVPANASASVVWSGEIDPSVPLGYLSILEDPNQGIVEPEDSKPLVIQLNTHASNSIVPLTELAMFSSRLLTESKNVRLQIPVRNLSDEITSSISLALSGPGAATDVKEVTLTAGRERRLDFPIHLPPAGDYQYQLSILNASQNLSYSIPVTVHGKPDLALAEGDFTFQPEQPVIGHTVYIRTTVYNVGEGPADDIYIYAYDGDPSLKRELRPYNVHRSLSIDHLEAGASKEITLAWDPKSYEGLGTHEIHIVADPKNRIDEISEENNRISAILTLHDLPDLAVDKWSGHSMSTQVVNGLATWGQPLQLKGRIRNIGDSDAHYVRYTFGHNKQEITYYYDKLPKGAVQETSIEIPLHYSRNILRVIADRYDLIGEKNETKEPGNNVSANKRVDYQLKMPLAPLTQGQRIYRVTDEPTFGAGRGDYVLYDDRHEALTLQPDLETVSYRITPAFVLDKKSFNYNYPNMFWQWNLDYICFYSPIQRDLPLQLKLPAPNGFYDIYLKIISPAYDEGKTEKIRVKTPKDSNFRILEHGKVESGDSFRLISSDYHIRDDQFLLELRPVTGGLPSVVFDIKFVHSEKKGTVSGGYLSPYFPADGSGAGRAIMTWDAEIPETTRMQVKARWVNQMKDGSLRFLPWARIAKGEKGSLEMPGKGTFFQYYVNFIRISRDSASPALKQVTISIPCQESQQG